MQLFTGREYLKIDIASNFGLDREDWDDRLAWFDQHEDHLEELVQQAKEPALYYAGVKAWQDVCAGRPIGYMISLDATSSGLQLLAALTGDKSAASICNVIDTGKREDAYTSVDEHMFSIVGEASQIGREKSKNAVMTSLYGSTAEPKKTYGEGALLNVFYDTMETLAPAAWELNQAFLSFWNSSALEHAWVLPDNFHVHVKVMKTVGDTVHFLNAPYDVTYQINAPTEEGRSLGANTIHSIDGMIVREITRRCDYNPSVIANLWNMIAGEVSWENSEADFLLVQDLWDHYQQSGYLSARILDHLDSNSLMVVDLDVIKELLLSLPAKPFKVVSIHDCFRVLPHYGNDLRRQYALQLQLIAKSNLLSFLIAQLLNRPVQVGKLHPELWTTIADTNYALS